MKKLLLISLLLITLISITAVSAADENATDTQILEADSENQIDYAIDDEDIANEKNNETVSQEELKDPGIQLSVPSEIVKNERLEIYYHLRNGDAVENLSCYIDDEFCTNFEVFLSGSIYLDVENYTLGKHSCTIANPGNEGYIPFNQTFQFEIVNVSFIYKKHLYEGYYSNPIYVKLPKDADGTVTIEINKTKKSFDANKIKEDYYRACKELSYDVENLEYGTHNLEINYCGNYGNITRKSNITIDYYFEIYNSDYYSSQMVFSDTSGVIFFLLEIPVKGTITAFIDGADAHYDINKLTPGTISRSPNYYDGMIFPLAPVYFNNLQIGNHTLTINYSGDSKYPAKTISQDFIVKPEPDFQFENYDECYIGAEIPITIILPEGNVGNFSLYASDDGGKNFTLIESVNLTNGKATLRYNCSKLGEYVLKTAYDTNYGRYEHFKDLKVSCIEFPYDSYENYLNCDFQIKVRLPNEGAGTFSLYVSKDWGKFAFYKSADIVNGHAAINFKTSKEGFYQFMAISDSNYGLENKTEGYLFEDGSKITPSSGNVFYNAAGKYSIKVYGSNGKPVGKNTVVNVKIGSKSIKTKTDKNGIATVCIKLKPSTYTVTAKYNNVKVSSDLTVKHIVKLKAVTVKRSSKKLTLQATLKNKKALKGKTVTFKFNGKTYKAKTNSNGIAKIRIKSQTLKKLKAGKKVTYQATYLKDTIKKTATVKK